MQKIASLYISAIATIYLIVYSQSFIYDIPLDGLSLYESGEELVWKLSIQFSILTFFCYLLLLNWQKKNVSLISGSFLIGYLILSNNLIFFLFDENVSEIAALITGGIGYTVVDFFHLSFFYGVSGFLSCCLIMVLNKSKYVAYALGFVFKYAVIIACVLCATSLVLMYMIISDHNSKGTTLGLSDDTSLISYWREVALTKGSVVPCENIKIRSSCDSSITHGDSLICESMKICIFVVLNSEGKNSASESLLLKECDMLKNNYGRDFCQKTVTGYWE